MAKRTTTVRPSTARSATARSTTERKRSPAKTPPVRAVLTTVDSREIAARAYQLFLDSDCRHGHDIDHWLRAEQELRERVLTSAA